MSVISTSRTGFLLTSIAAACVLTACGGNDNNSPASASNSGVVAAAGFMPGSTTGNPTLKAGFYAGAANFSAAVTAMSSNAPGSGE